MKRELAVVKKKRGMDGGEEKRGGKHFFFLASVVMRHCKRQTEWQTVQESKRGQLLGEKQEWQRLRESDGKTIADRKIYRSETAVVQHHRMKKKCTSTEKQVGCTAPAELLFIQIKPGGLFECLRLCVFWCVHASAYIFVVRKHTSVLFACVCMCVCMCVHGEH